MDQAADSPIFCCDNCGSVSVVVDGPLSDTAPVKCGGCGTDLGPWRFFVDEVSWTLANLGATYVRQKPVRRIEDLN
jgi:hypothetical protein